MYDCFFPCVHVRGEMYSLIKNVDTNFNLKCYALIRFHQNEVILIYSYILTLHCTTIYTTCYIERLHFIIISLCHNYLLSYPRILQLTSVKL